MGRLQGCQWHGLCCAPQAAKTYLEKHFETFPTASLDDLVQHGLKALSATLSEGELTKQNVSIAVVGGGAPFVMLDDDDVEPYVAVSSVLQGFTPQTRVSGWGGVWGVALLLVNQEDSTVRSLLLYPATACVLSYAQG